MAKSPGKVLEFLTDLREKLAPLGVKEIASLRKLKADDYAAKGLAPESAMFSSWDFRHYTNREMEAEYNVGGRVLLLLCRPHAQSLRACRWTWRRSNSIFRSRCRTSLAWDVGSLLSQQGVCINQTVTDNMFGIYERLLGLKFEEVEFTEALAPWHPEVKLFAVLDSTADVGEGVSCAFVFACLCVVSGLAADAQALSCPWLVISSWICTHAMASTLMLPRSRCVLLQWWAVSVPPLSSCVGLA